MFKIYNRLKLSSNSLFSKDNGCKLLNINKNINIISPFGTYSNQDNQQLLSTIQWYPGHIAKAERELVDYLKRVDVVIEVRDARIPLSTTHPKVPQWVENRPLIVVITRLDQISSQALADWKEYYLKNPAHPSKPETKVFFIDGKIGSGVANLKKFAFKLLEHINEKRKKQGIQPRAIRGAIIGYPNIGKSALINRLLGKYMAVSKNLPGVTKSLRWVKLSKDAQSQQGNIELLDSPGIIPARQSDQNGAINLAICNDIGEASYDRIVVSIALCDKINKLYINQPAYVDMYKIIDRYKIPFNKLTGEEILYEIANKYFSENQVLAADKILSDFRNGLYGYSSLESPIFDDDDDGDVFVSENNLLNNNHNSLDNYYSSKDNNFDGW